MRACSASTRAISTVGRRLDDEAGAVRVPDDRAHATVAFGARKREKPEVPLEPLRVRLDIVREEVLVHGTRRRRMHADIAVEQDAPRRDAEHEVDALALLDLRAALFVEELSVGDAVLVAGLLQLGDAPAQPLALERLRARPEDGLRCDGVEVRRLVDRSEVVVPEQRPLAVLAH